MSKAMGKGIARPTVAVIGGGYGGSAVAKALDEDTDVVLIDPKDAFVHAAGSLRALVKPDWADNIFFPYDTLLQRVGSSGTAPPRWTPRV